ncbi:MAG: hypothetical protein COA96_04580 [SAR86 cluster bacterium]|uniref:HTH araC/xylS-type domain-containing protein n=1 Tax=SAR86 cluster bacterium TaxID=2030880 RepID=A0A2A5B6D3_9GAMM|nr:MAG: hypothetical protein COA96_04580 [SAR86 cluster bacterium]
MHTINIYISMLAISQFIFLGAHFLTHQRNAIGRLVALFSLCVIAYLLDDSIDIDHSYNFIADLVLGELPTLAPFLLWMIATYLFVDERKEHSLAWVAISCCFILDTYLETSFPNTQGLRPQSLAYVIARFLPQLILLSFPLHAIYLVIRGYKMDLLEERRKLRIAFVAGLGGVIIFILTGNIINDFFYEGLEEASELYVLISSSSLFAVALFLNLESIQTSKDLMIIVSEDTPGNDTDEFPVNTVDMTDSESARAIQHAIVNEHLYREPGFTISDLADHLNLLEYRVRKIINKSMQYKNFNQFLNTYRIEEACSLLSSTELPVSHIAMDVGYSSLSVFNRVFKERTNETPSEYRKRYLRY